MCNVMRSSSVMHSHPSATQPFLQQVIGPDWWQLLNVTQAFAFLSSRSWITPKLAPLAVLAASAELTERWDLGRIADLRPDLAQCQMRQKKLTVCPLPI